MKLKHALYILIFAVVIRFFAMTFKFYHWPGFDWMLILSQALLFVAVACGIYVLVKNRDVRELLKGKLRYGIFIVVVGAAVKFTGFLFKLQHWPGAEMLLLVSYIVLVAGFACILWALGTDKKVQEFLKRK